MNAAALLLGLLVFDATATMNPAGASIQAAQATLEPGLQGIAWHQNPGDAHHLLVANVSSQPVPGSALVVHAFYQTPSGHIERIQLFPRSGGIYAGTVLVSVDPLTVAERDSALEPNYPMFAPTQYTIVARRVHFGPGFHQIGPTAVQVVIP